MTEYIIFRQLIYTAAVVEKPVESVHNLTEIVKIMGLWKLYSLALFIKL